jgi:hypothetical protein
MLLVPVRLPPLQPSLKELTVSHFDKLSMLAVGSLQGKEYDVDLNHEAFETDVLAHSHQA